MNLFLTADEIGSETGGGSVTFHESEALRSLGDAEIISLTEEERRQDPFTQDESILQKVKVKTSNGWYRPSLVHCYAGCLSKTVSYLKEVCGSKITYTVAAHDKKISEREHRKLGLDFPYAHLTKDSLWREYIRGYLASDCIVCPSTHSSNIVRDYPYSGRIEIIPHGCWLPEKIASHPELFTVGYLGAIGPDKGVMYLLEAWKKLNYKDAVLMIGGRDSISAFFQNTIQRCGGGNIVLLGWVKNVSDFYNQISLYVQPSATEGFGIEILEAMAHGRPVLCSEGVGGVDVINSFEHYNNWKFKSCSVNELAEKIDYAKKEDWCLGTVGLTMRKYVFDYTWDKIREKYVKLWKEILR